MSDIAVSIQNVSKVYRIIDTRQRATTLAEALTRLPRATNRQTDFWALRDVSLEIRKGEVLGVIGRNGAGKSTLLKILSRITEPTSGVIDLYGRVGSLLEVGTGFHPELTGRENIFLNGAILGMSRREIGAQFDSIVAFAGVEQFLETPVKKYSSGMYVRLAFAVAAHLNPEILIVDEVLAVGDLEFQRKSIARMEEAAGREGKTIIFVSHNMPAVAKLCTRVALLNAGRIETAGSTQPVIREYLAKLSKPDTIGSNVLRDEIPQPFEELCVDVLDAQRQPTKTFNIGQPWLVTVEFRVSKSIQHLIVAIGLQTVTQIPIMSIWSQPADIMPGCYDVEFLCDLPLSAGEISLTLGISTFERTILYNEGLCLISILDVAVEQQPFRTSGAGLVASFARPMITPKQSNHVDT